MNDGKEKYSWEKIIVITSGILAIVILVPLAILTFYFELGSRFITAITNIQPHTVYKIVAVCFLIASIYPIYFGLRELYKFYRKIEIERQLLRELIDSSHGEENNRKILQDEIYKLQTTISAQEGIMDEHVHNN